MATTTTTTTNYIFPEYYHFPPFFTVQPNRSTQSKQISLWCTLILAYLKQSVPTVATKSRASTSTSTTARSILIPISSESLPLFTNSSINRTLPREGIKLVCDQLVKLGYGTWLANSLHPTCLVSSIRIDEIAKAISEHANENNLAKGIATFYELRLGDAARQAIFYGIDENLLYAALVTLSTSGKCSLIPGESINETGIKFHA